MMSYPWSEDHTIATKIDYVAGKSRSHVDEKWRQCKWPTANQDWPLCSPIQCYIGRKLDNGQFVANKF